MSEQPEVVSTTPTSGTRRFRRNTRITVRDGTLTVTDRRKRSSSAPLDGSPSSPKFVKVIIPQGGKGRGDLVIEDGEGRSFALADVGRWDSFDIDDVVAAGGLERRVGFHPDQPGALRPDGRILRDSAWWVYGPAVGPITFAAAMASNSGLFPRLIGFPVALAGFVYLMAALFSGAYTGRREGRDVIADRARRAAAAPATSPGTARAGNAVAPKSPPSRKRPKTEPGDPQRVSDHD